MFNGQEDASLDGVSSPRCSRESGGVVKKLEAAGGFRVYCDEGSVWERKKMQLL